METINILIFGGIVGSGGLLWGNYFLFRKYKQAKKDLIRQVDFAEKEFQKDFQDIDQDELKQTKAGRELLNFLNPTTAFNTSDNVNSQQKVALNFSNSFFYLAISILVLAFFLGLNIKDAIWLNSNIASAQAEQIQLQTTTQQQIYELEIKRLQTEVEQQQAIQEQQKRLEQDLQAQKAIQVQQLEIQEKTLQISWIIVLTMSISLLALMFIIVYRTLKKASRAPLISE